MSVYVTFVFISRLYIPRIFLLDPHIINLVAQTVNNLPAMQKTGFPGSGRSSGEGSGYPLLCSGLGNPMDRGAWWATVHGVPKNWTWQNH